MEYTIFLEVYHLVLNHSLYFFKLYKDCFLELSYHCCKEYVMQYGKEHEVLEIWYLFGPLDRHLVAFLSNLLAEKQNSRPPLLCQNCKEITQSKFSTDTELCGAVNVLAGRDATQRDQDRLGRWNHEKKVKCKVLIWARHKYRLGRESVSALLRRVLGVSG